MKRKGSFLITIGVLMLAAALGLTGYNLYESGKARATSDYAVEELMEVIRSEETKETMYEDVPDYMLHPEKEMPMIKVQDEYYIGVLEIPDLELILPVIGGEWSYDKLLQAPCRYAGSIYENNMVIAAHNYSSHFGNIHNLDNGSKVYFIDTEGHVFSYIVGWIDVLDSNQSEEMKEAADWDLTLFTCTYSGQERYTIRCIKCD